MKQKIFLAIAVLVASVQALSADFCESDGCNCSWSDCLGFDSVLTVDIGGGYRSDNLKWKTFPSSEPGSEVREKWKNLGIGIIDANAQFLACEHYLLKVDFDYGWFNKSGHQHATVIDFDTETFNSFKARPKGNVYDISGALGYQFNLDCYRVSFAPLVGYSYHYQKYHASSYSHKIGDIGEHGTVDLGEGVFNNHYRYRWRGPWVGFAASYQIDCGWQVYVDYGYHWLRYRGTVHENFPTPPGQFPLSQKCNNVSGNEVTVGSTFQFGDCWFLGLKFNYKNFTGNKGHSENHDSVSRLRGLDFTCYTGAVDIGYSF